MIKGGGTLVLEKSFWRAIEMAFGSYRDEDIADVARYVASRGEAGVAGFTAELEKAIKRLRGAGVVEVLRREATTTDGRAFADLSQAEADQGLEAMILSSRQWFEVLLADPDAARGPRTVHLLDLRQAVEAARNEPGIDDLALWVERPGDRRRDGNPWIVFYHSLGVGLRTNSQPWNIRGFSARYDKVALLRSLDDSWRAWRSTIRAEKLDVWLEYWPPGDEKERMVVTDRGKTTAVTVYRDASRATVAGDPIEIAEDEAKAVLDEVRTTLSPT